MFSNRKQGYWAVKVIFDGSLKPMLRTETEERIEAGDLLCSPNGRDEACSLARYVG